MKQVGTVFLFLPLLAFSSVFAAVPDFDKIIPVKDLIGAAVSAGYEPAVPVHDAGRPRAVKEWTIMVFMNGKNDLTDYTLNDINEMEMTGAPESVNLVVETGRKIFPPPTFPNGFPNIPGFPGMAGVPQVPVPADYRGKTFVPAPDQPAWAGVRRYYIQRDSNPKDVTSPVLEELRADMGDWRHLAEFGLWAKAKFPARHYMLVVWDHGSGWKSGRKAAYAKGISYDDDTGHNISGVELGRALAKMGGADIYASDACLMQMVEVAYELKDHASVIVGSEEKEPGDGWPYHYFLNDIQSAELAAENIAGAAVQAFTRYYGEKKRGVTISALHTRNLAGLKTLADQWAELAMGSGERAAINQARNEVKTFSNVESRDLFHLMTLVAAKVSSPELKAKSLELAGYLSENVVFSNSTYGDRNKDANGLAIYLPFSIPDNTYLKLAWAKAGNWYEFVKWTQKSGQ